MPVLCRGHSERQSCAGYDDGGIANLAIIAGRRKVASETLKFAGGYKRRSDKQKGCRHNELGHTRLGQLAPEGSHTRSVGRAAGRYP